jgi:hypothetical protein
MENLSSEFAKTRSGKMKKINQASLKEMPQTMRQAMDICSEVTLFTRGKSAEPGILKLQDKVNEIFELIQFAQPDNVESDEQTKIGAAAEDLRQEFGGIKKTIVKFLVKNLESQENFMRKVVLESKKKGLLKTAKSQFELQEKVRVASGKSEDLEKLKSIKDEYLKTIEESDIENPEDLEKLSEKLVAWSKIYWSDLIDAYLGVWIPEVFEAIQDLQKLREQAEKLNEKSHVNEIEDLKKQADKKWSAIRKEQNIQESPYEKMALAIDKPVADESFEKTMAKAREWFEKSRNNDALKLRVELLPDKGKNTFTDSVYLSVINKTKRGADASFDLLLTEYLGVRQFIDNGKFEIKEILADLEAAAGEVESLRIEDPKAKDAVFEKKWHDYGHVDSDYRQLTGEFGKLNKEQSQKIMEVFTEFIRAKRVKK